MKKNLRAVIASSLFLGTAAGMSAISTTQIMINLRPIIIHHGVMKKKEIQENDDQAKNWIVP